MTRRGMARLVLFYRLIVRSLLRDRVRSALAVLTLALGVAVVLAIEMAGEAAAGSFRSSVETLSGREDFEITAVGGVPSSLVGRLARLPFPWRVSPRIESAVVARGVRRAFLLVGVDLVSSAADLPAGQGVPGARPGQPAPSARAAFQGSTSILGRAAVLVPTSLGRNPGDTIDLLVNDTFQSFSVAGVIDASAASDLIVMDIATADRALGRHGRVDRILVSVPPAAVPGAPATGTAALETWEARLEAALPAGVTLARRGAAKAENQRMLAAFRWNLRILSYVALVVGAFLIYNTISVSVVRRRAEIGIVRALGASRRTVTAAFIAEAAFLGFLGALVGLPFGRLMAKAAVGLIAGTVNALYVSSRPGAIAYTPASILLAFGLGIGVAIVSAVSPAREAGLVSPVDAMARGRRDFVIRVHRWRDLVLATILGLAAFAAAQAPAWRGIPVLGYLASVLAVGACCLSIPAFVSLLASHSSRWLGRALGVEALLASRSLAGSLRRTSVLVAALATAISMTTSVGIMVGSFRETVLVWLGGALPADLYLSPIGGPAFGRHLDPGLADRIERVPGVAAVDRFRSFEIHYRGRPATLAFCDARVNARHSGMTFLSGRPARAVISQLIDHDSVIVGEPFANKHGLRPGDVLSLPLGGTLVSFRVIDVYYDYTGERGFVTADRSRLLRYLPDQATPSTLAVYLASGADAEATRNAVRAAAADSRVVVVSNAEIRRMAVTIFDRTFAITYALEAVAVFVAVMGVAGALIALVIDRRRELGLLRFLGASRSQVRRLILFEAGLLGLLANVAGLALGVAISLLLVFVVNKQSFGWTIQFHWPVAVLLGGLTIVYVATLLAAIYPALVATRLNPIEVVHEE